jgi:hypothetical protein
MQPLLAAGAAVLILLAGNCSQREGQMAGPSPNLPVKVEPILISRLGAEHFGNAIYRRGREGPRIAASGNRILEWPIRASAPVMEVVQPSSQSFQNGACAMDVNGDGIDEMIVSRTAEDQRGTDLLWFEEIPGQSRWKEHLIAHLVKGENEEGLHDIQPMETAVSGKPARGVVIVANRRHLYWYEIPGDPVQPWKEHLIADLGGFGATAAQSGLVLGDVAGDGRSDVVCGNFWAECPADPAGNSWEVHRYSRWDERATPNLPGLREWVLETRFGGMNQLGLADMDGDGSLDIIASEAEIPEARVGVFCRTRGDFLSPWKETLVDSGLYCPHSLVAADVNTDGRPDIIVGEMTAGGWWFPRNPGPKLYLYLNEGDLKFQKFVLHTGWGLHMMGMIPRPNPDRIFVFAADEIQSWYEDMSTTVAGWTISPKK